MPESFRARLERVIVASGRLCVGIDPHAGLLARWGLPATAAGAREFGLRVVDAAAGRVGVVKPQVAFFERYGSAGYTALEDVLAAARSAGLFVIADAKRGDIGTTVEAYGEAWLTPGWPLEADALTVVAYQGLGSLEPVITLAESVGKGLFVLAATSNPEAASTQRAVRADARTVAAGIVADIHERGSQSLGVVIGATVEPGASGIAPSDLAGLPVLSPGFGVQGAVLADAARLFGAAYPLTLANVSRSVLGAGPDGLVAAIMSAKGELGGMTQRTPPDVDRVAAAQAAVAARRARAAVKASIAQRERRALEVAEAAWNGPATAPEATLRVRELLMSVPTLGPTRADRVMEQLGIAPSKRVGGLGIRQRVRLREYLLAREGGSRTPSRLVVLAGPTAVGKGTVSRYIHEHYPNVTLSISATTRPPRVGEIDGTHYYFVSDAQFDDMVERGEFLEWATVHNAYRYGTPRPPIDAALAQGRSVLLEIDLQGARAVRSAMPEALLVFLLPPTWDELVRRLVGRGTEDSVEQARRLATARVELRAQDEFDVKVVNNEVGQAAREVVELLAVPGDPGASASQKD